MTPAPRWYRFAWFLGPPPSLTERQWRVLGLVSAVSFFEQYDVFLFQLNLAQIQRSLALPEGDLAGLGSIVRAGALFAFLVTVFADRIGRRRVLLVTVAVYTLLTFATAFAQDATTFVALQFFARVFAVAETLLAAVVIVEEFPDEHRGWGVGAFAAIQACGAGTAALIFGFVDHLPFGWRSMYVIGVIPLLFVLRWRLTFPETERFSGLASTPGLQRGNEPLRLLRDYGGRFAIIASTAFLLAFGLAGVGFFQVKYLQDVHGWSPPAVAAITVIGGGLAIVANPLAGRLSDRMGRRPLATLFLFGAGIAGATFYAVDAAWAVVFWVVYLFMQFGADTALVTYAAESFPTSLRGTASGMRVIVSTLGGVSGLAAVGALYPYFGSNWAVLQFVPLVCLLAAAIAYFGFRETARARLEAIAPE